MFYRSLERVDRNCEEARDKGIGCHLLSPRKPVEDGIFAQRLILLLLFLCLLLCGCATLPKVQDISEPPRTDRPPTIVGSHGPLSLKTSKAIIGHLKRQAEPTDILERHNALMESITGSPLIAGNRVTLLIDGPATYAAMFKAIENAKDHIHFETYIFDDDEVGHRFADLLLQKHSEGIRVNLIYDSLGSFNTAVAFFQRFRDSGIQTLEFNPISPLKAHEGRFLTHRDHRKLLIVDGNIAFTGGVNISSVYSSSLSEEHRGSPKESWRDTHIQIEGPAVSEFQKLFLDTWAREKGPELSKRNFFPTPKREGSDLLRIVGSTPGQKNRMTYIMYVSAITFAQNSIHLTNPYFVPDRQTLEALVEAARRGVDVKIILPGTSDETLVYYASRSFYTKLLKSGVKLYERRGSVLHAKTAVIDGVWSTVGSTNMDLWSFLRER